MIRALLQSLRYEQIYLNMMMKKFLFSINTSTIKLKMTYLVLLQKIAVSRIKINKYKIFSFTLGINKIKILSYF